MAYFERKTHGDQAENFVRWSESPKDETWTTLGSFGPLTPQRLTVYPKQIPRAAGVDANVSLLEQCFFPSQSPQLNINQSQAYALSGNQLSYVYKRNFTLGLASPSTASDGAAWALAGNPASSWTLRDGTFPVGTDGSDVRAIACAVNTFGQDDIFHAPYNALCYNGGNIAGRGMLLTSLVITSTKPLS